MDEINDIATENQSVRSPRFSVPAQARLSLQGGQEEHPGRLINISCHGALFKGLLLFPVRTYVMLHFDIIVSGLERNFSIPGTITRSDTGGTGIDFGAVPIDAQELLTEFTFNRLFGREDV